jgi:hypothetical protein
MRIKVTGYLSTEDLDDEHVDESHSMGLSEAGFNFYATELALDDVSFQRMTEAEYETDVDKGLRPKNVPEGYVWVEGHWRKQ